VSTSTTMSGDNIVADFSTHQWQLHALSHSVKLSEPAEMESLCVANW